MIRRFGGSSGRRGILFGFGIGVASSTAAAFAAKDAHAVQDVDIAALRARLRADGQRFRQ